MNILVPTRGVSYIDPSQPNTGPMSEIEVLRDLLSDKGIKLNFNF